MFASTYFPRRYFADAYFPDGGGEESATYPEPDEVLAGVEYGPNGNDYTGTLVDLSAVLSALAAIQSKTDLIGTGSAITNAPVTALGNLTTIVIGDDYLAANSRAFEWLVDAIPEFAIADCTCWFGGQANGCTVNAWLVSGSASVSGTKWKLSFDLPATATQSLDRGSYEWSVAVHHGGKEVTRVRNKDTHKVSLVSKFT